jgi:hypothetical protein
VQTWFIMGGVVTLLMAITMFFVPAIMNFEKGRNGATVETDQAEISLAVNPGE